MTYKDRLARFGFDLMELVCRLNGTNIVVLNTTEERDYQEELTQDLISIIQHFSAKVYSGRRRQLKELQKSRRDDMSAK